MFILCPISNDVPKLQLTVIQCIKYDNFVIFLLIYTQTKEQNANFERRIGANMIELSITKM